MKTDSTAAKATLVVVLATVFMAGGLYIVLGPDHLTIKCDPRDFKGGESQQLIIDKCGQPSTVKYTDKYHYPVVNFKPNEAKEKNEATLRYGSVLSKHVNFYIENDSLRSVQMVGDW